MIEVSQQPTITALKASYKDFQDRAGKIPRPHLGASVIGDTCQRKIFYSFRWATPRLIEFKGHAAINDGHRGEIIVAEMLRATPNIQLWTVDPSDPQKQIGFLDRHFGGSLDGVIKGLQEAPVTPHVWENKVVNETKFKKLDALRLSDEKSALENWDENYYGQAQVLMKHLHLSRHFLTVATPGVRDIISVRTDYNPVVAERLTAVAHKLSTDDDAPPRISARADWYECKFCNHSDVCHNGAHPQRNCRTCARVTPMADGTWVCSIQSKTLTFDDQVKGCENHRFNPSMLKDEFEKLEDDMVFYKSGFVDSGVEQA